MEITILGQNDFIKNNITVNDEDRVILIPDWIENLITKGKGDRWYKTAMNLQMLHPNYDLCILHIVR